MARNPTSVAGGVARRLRRIGRLLGAGALCLTVGAAPFQAAVPKRRVLFIGNSLTLANDLPRMVERLSAASGAPLSATVVAFDGFSLSDHWEHGAARAAIRRGGWDSVVLQQGPSSLAKSRAQLGRDTARFDVEIRRTHARAALFGVWPPKSRAAFFDAVSGSYADAARAVDGLFLPAGDAWRVAWKVDPQLALYGPDDFHPSPLGSLLAAMVVSRALTGHPVPEAAVLTHGRQSTDQRVWCTLRDAAEDVCTRAREQIARGGRRLAPGSRLRTPGGDRLQMRGSGSPTRPGGRSLEPGADLATTCAPRRA